MSPRPFLKEPDPTAPVKKGGGVVAVRELVRINHLRNCSLCHAQAVDVLPRLRAPIPDPKQPLPRVYYDAPRGPRVYADIVLLRQDFSVMQEVANRGKWPKWQRFDYVVREREVKPSDRATLRR